MLSLYNLEHLKKNLIPNLESFIRELLDEEANDPYLRLDNPSDLARALYSESLVFLFRILIIWLAESRGLLPLNNPRYHSHSLTKLITRLKTTPEELSSEDSTKLWNALWNLFTMLERGVNNPHLRLKPLKGQIFSKDALSLFRTLSLSDKAMSKFLDALFFSSTASVTEISNQKKEVDGTDVTLLGFVHEMLLYLEPHIATEDLVELKVSTSKVKYIPRRLVHESTLTKCEVMRNITKGQFYFRNWNGTKKGSGTYYTPRELTEFLVESTLCPLVEEKSPSQILELKILDPAVGSGAFLVAATRYLTKCYLKASQSGSTPTTKFNRDDELKARRLIVKHCIFGVDLNPLAVELAKVSLWLLTLQKDRSLDFLESNIRVGNSLLGFTNLFGDEFQVISKWLRKTLSADISSKKLVQSPRNALKVVLDVMILSYLQQGTSGRNHALSSALSSKTLGNVSVIDTDMLMQLKNFDLDKQSAKKWSIFHWALEFPEIFQQGGFDAIITNPPWNILKPNSNEFFTKFIPEFRTYKKKERLLLMNQLLKNDVGVREQWEEYLEEMKSLSRYFKKSGLYQKQFRGDLNLYKLFLERCFKLLKQGGILGIIIPSAIYTDLGSRELRWMLFQEATLKFLISLENREGIFGIHKSYKVVLLVAQKKRPRGDHNFKVAFCIGSRPRPLKKKKLSPRIIASRGFAPKKEELAELLVYLRDQGLPMNFSIVKQLNPETFALVEIKNDTDLSIVKKLHSQFERFQSKSENLPWNVRLNREFDMTNDLSYFLMADQARALFGVKGTLPLETIPSTNSFRCKTLIWKSKSPRVLPLYEGKMIWQFNPFFAPARYWVAFPPQKQLKSMSVQKIIPYRAAFRAISGSTNERTLVSCVLPPAYHGNTLQSLMISIDDRTSHDVNEGTLHLLACGMLNSIVLDWIVRLKVSSGLNYHFVHSLPFPRLTPKDAIFRQLIPRIARLTCITLDFAKLWKETYREDWMLEVRELSALKDWKYLSPRWKPSCGARDFVMFKDEMRDGHTRALLRAEIDVLIAHLFKLDQEEFLHMLEAFPVLQKKEIKFLGEYRTKKLILERWDDLSSF